MTDSSGIDPLGGARRDIYTVTEISEAVRQHLESEFPQVSVIGEIANFKLHTSGHAYFTLRDSANMIHAVLFRRYADRVACAPANGMLVIAPGRVSHFGGSGQTQLIATDLIPAGHGGMELEFRRLLKKLMDEGLTAADRKRPVARYPEKIAVITSPTGAVVRDVVGTLRRRWPVAEIVRVSTEVQGPGAVRSIVRAFEITNGMCDVDTVILARGGGSIEDLWSFNSEEVARAVAGSAHPVVTGIGHEIDTTVADHVADMRAATPTAAAELATPRAEEVLGALGASIGRLASLEAAVLAERRHLVAYLLRSSAFPAIERRMERAELAIDASLERISNRREAAILAFAHRIEDGMRDMRRLAAERIERSGTALDTILDGLESASPYAALRFAADSIVYGLRLIAARVRGGLVLRMKELGGRLAALAELDPRGVLRRGYSLCTEESGARVIPRAREVSPGDRITVHFYDGGVQCSVREKRRGSPWRKR